MDSACVVCLCGLGKLVVDVITITVFLSNDMLISAALSTLRRN